MNNAHYKNNIGAVIRGLLNGLKHTPETIAPIIGVEQKVIEEIIGGKQELTADIEQKLISVAGLNQQDLYPAEFAGEFPIVDDTDLGVRIVRAAETKASERILSRGPANIPYYIYADTAMSNTSTFRPEWIKELFVHNGETADLPEWAFNKGHFEHQMTYFIGPVNFYWIDKSGVRHVTQMNTGDTNYISPFVPHTFTTREEDKGLILAVTYGGAIANPTFKAEIGVMPVEDFLKHTKEKLAQLPFAIDEKVVAGVAILKHENAQNGNLVQCDYQPDTRTREITFIQGAISESVSSDRWIYNVGSESITIEWGNGKSSEIQTDDSLFIKPNTTHALKGNEQAKLLVVDIKPGAGDPLIELKAIETYAGDAGLSRVHTETTRWY